MPVEGLATKSVTEKTTEGLGAKQQKDPTKPCFQGGGFLLLVGAGGYFFSFTGNFLIRAFPFFL